MCFWHRKYIDVPDLVPWFMHCFYFITRNAPAWLGKPGNAYSGLYTVCADTGRTAVIQPKYDRYAIIVLWVWVSFLNICMNEAHLHVAINHFPVVGAVIGMVIIIAGLLKKNDAVVEAALWLFVGLALLAIPVLLTGQAAKEMLEHFPGIEEDVIEKHEGLAKITVWILVITGFLSLCQLYLTRIKKQPGRFTALVAFLAVVASGSAAITANAGGKVRHSEFENGATINREEMKEEEKQEEEMDKKNSKKRKGRDH